MGEQVVVAAVKVAVCNYTGTVKMDQMKVWQKIKKALVPKGRPCVKHRWVFDNDHHANDLQAQGNDHGCRCRLSEL
jgi:hypothetical protein